MLPRALRTSITAVAAFGLVVVAGCAPAPPTVDCSKVTAPKYSELTIWPLCTSCHATTATGQARRSAPGGVNYDTYLAAVPQAESGAAQVNAGNMPPSHDPQPTAAQKDALFAWAMCGTPN